MKLFSTAVESVKVKSLRTLNQRRDLPLERCEPCLVTKGSVSLPVTKQEQRGNQLDTVGSRHVGQASCIEITFHRQWTQNAT